jgi:hypothetical protein
VGSTSWAAMCKQRFQVPKVNVWRVCANGWAVKMMLKMKKN